MRLPTVKFIPQKVDTKKAFSLIRSAVDQGINYFDTAWPYHFGGSEKILGMALQNGYREKVHLVTKLFMPLVRKQEDFDKFLDRQLIKLQTDHLDTYLFHGLNRGAFEKIKHLNLIENMIKARAQGKIRYIGFSFHDTLPVYKEIIDYFDWNVTQIQYNYMDTGIQATLEGLQYAGSKNIAVVLSGMSSQKQLKENVASAENSGIGSLSAEDLDTIDELVKIYSKNIVVPCTACQYCMNCPSGVNIPQNFAILNNVASDKRGIYRWQIKRSYKKLVNTPEKLNKDKTNGNALVCTECGICVPKCPQSINIPEELKKVNLVMEKGKKINELFNTAS